MDILTTSVACISWLSSFSVPTFQLNWNRFHTITSIYISNTFCRRTILVSPLFWRLRGKQNFAMVKSVMNLITMGFTIVSLRLLFFSLFLTSSIFSLTPPQPSCLAACSVSVVTQKGFQRGECYVFYIPRLFSQKKTKSFAWPELNFSFDVTDWYI